MTNQKATHGADLDAGRRAHGGLPPLIPGHKESDVFARGYAYALAQLAQFIGVVPYDALPDAHLMDKLDTAFTSQARQLAHMGEQLRTLQAEAIANSDTARMRITELTNERDVLARQCEQANAEVARLKGLLERQGVSVLADGSTGRICPKCKSPGGGDWSQCGDSCPMGGPVGLRVLQHSHYFHDVRHLETIDIYRMIDLCAIEHPAMQHAFKKVAKAGKRGAKSELKDAQEAIDSLQRFIAMRKEDEQRAAVDYTAKPGESAEQYQRRTGRAMRGEALGATK